MSKVKISLVRKECNFIKFQLRRMMIVFALCPTSAVNFNRDPLFPNTLSVKNNLSSVNENNIGNI